MTWTGSRVGHGSREPGLIDKALDRARQLVGMDRKPVGLSDKGLGFVRAEARWAQWHWTG